MREQDGNKDVATDKDKDMDGDRDQLPLPTVLLLLRRIRQQLLMCVNWAWGHRTRGQTGMGTHRTWGTWMHRAWGTQGMDTQRMQDTQGHMPGHGGHTELFLCPSRLVLSPMTDRG